MQVEETKSSLLQLLPSSQTTPTAHNLLTNPSIMEPHSYRVIGVMANICCVDDPLIARLDFFHSLFPLPTPLSPISLFL